MNLNSIAASAINAVNPNIDIRVKASTGYTVDTNFNQTPKYTERYTCGQIQSLTSADLKKLNGLNIQGVEQKVYLDGNFEGCFRQLGLGGDLLEFAYGSSGIQTYLVTAVIERWPEWCCVGVTMQVSA